MNILLKPNDKTTTPDHSSLPTSLVYFSCAGGMVVRRVDGGALLQEAEVTLSDALVLVAVFVVSPLGVAEAVWPDVVDVTVAAGGAICGPNP